jgi:hypothetical protein
MEWTMPRPVLQAVAALLVLAAAVAFAMGVMRAPDRGRMPGERAPGDTGPAASVIEAPEATPLSQERIEGPPKPAEKPATNTQAADEDEASDDETDAVNATATNTIAPAKPTIRPPGTATNTLPPAAGQATNTLPPSAEAPPY